MAKRLIVLVALTVALSAAALMIGGPAPQADASGSLAAVPACPNPGYYSGTSNSGNFQDALDNAIGAASACTGCCDFLVTWDFVSADGREGGFAGFNEANVTIKASW